MKARRFSGMAVLLSAMTLLLAAGLLLVSSTPLPAADSAKLTEITSVEGITEYRLDNGLKVLLFPDESKPTVTVNLTIFVGSRHEGYGEAGMAHLLEHMLFKGTPTFPKVPKVLQSHGADFNGTTWLDRTNYYETLPANDDNLEFAIKLEADRMINSYVKAEDLVSEMTVVRNEFEQGENRPTSVLWQRMMSAAFEWHNYGKSTIGNRADIERVPIEKLQAFYKKYYQPDNAMLVVAGQFDHEKALEFIANYFGAIPQPKRKLDQTYTEEPAQDGERIITLRRVGDVAVVGAVYHIPAGPHADYVAIDVLESVLTASPSGRLYKALVETKKSANVFGSALALHDPGALIFLTEVAVGNEPQVVIDTMLDVLGGIGEDAITQEEVERAKLQLLKQWEITSAKSKEIAIQLSEWAAQGDWRLYFLYRDRIEKVTAEDVQNVAIKYLQQSNRTLGLFTPVKSPSRAKIPATPNLADLIGDYKGREKVSAGEAFDVSPANIDARTTRFTLPSGIKVAFLQKKTRGEAVRVRLTLRFGDVENLRGLATAVDFLPSLMVRGTKNLDRLQLQDELDKHRARLSAATPFFRSGVANFSIETKREHLAKVLDLLRQVLREPTFPEQELDILKNQQLASLEKRRSDPTFLATKTVSRKMNSYEKDDPRYVTTIAEEIERVKSLDIESIKQVYDQFLGATHGELAIVGDFDADEAKKVMAETLADWESTKPYSYISRVVNKDVKGGTKSILTPDKANATYFAAMAFPMKDDDPDYPALVLGNFILGGGSLSSRLGDRVRQKDGLSYGIGSSFRASAIDNRATFSIFAICNPLNMKKVQTAIVEEIDLLLKDGIPAEELKSAKQGYLQNLKVGRTSDGALASMLTNNLNTDRTMKFQARLEQKIAALSAKEIVTALRKHIDPKKLFIAAAGDFEKKAETKKEPTEKKKTSSKD